MEEKMDNKKKKKEDNNALDLRGLYTFMVTKFKEACCLPQTTLTVMILALYL
jgi:hypothetical protein